MNEGKPFNPWWPAAPTGNEVELSNLLAECLPYLRVIEMQQESTKLADLIQRIVKKVA